MFESSSMLALFLEGFTIDMEGRFTWFPLFWGDWSTFPPLSKLIKCQSQFLCHVIAPSVIGVTAFVLGTA